MGGELRQVANFRVFDESSFDSFFFLFLGEIGAIWGGILETFLILGLCFYVGPEILTSKVKVQKRGKRVKLRN